VVQVPQEHLIVPDCRPFGAHSPVAFVRSVGVRGAQPVRLQPAPPGLDRIEFRRPGRPCLPGQAIGEMSRQLADRVPLVHRAAVPDDPEPPGQRVPHRLEKDGPLPVIEGVIDQRPRVQSQSVPERRPPPRRRDGDLLARATALVQGWRLAPRRPGTRARKPGGRSYLTRLKRYAHT
jgi:hypothetical protein